ncbi:hypothetical protein [Arthrobacter sp. SDTb3-6]|uniref:hypothetical protein n=1 Tax=Arthrobacter sp. SDTb3-6 TaxID=2713571 RepID=UPI00159DCF8E|nr:hypothetical protein [Arthrobacter sp. SDTb3-6]NVM97753.1 hypothetical protein [Arthrobacter sp. SDTb3-6]
MGNHPQVEAFCEAAELMRRERYWRRNENDEIDFLRALVNVVREVAYHLDAVRALDIDGVAAYIAAAGLGPWAGNVNAELVLMTAVDHALERRLAMTSASRNTGVQ